MALVHRNAALGKAPVGQLSFVREAYVSLRPGAQPRRDRLRSPLRLVSKDSGQVPKVPRGHRQKWAGRNRVGRGRT